MIGSTLGAVDRPGEWPLRWANRRRQLAAGVPCARCWCRPVGLGRRDGPAAGLGYSSGEATIRTKHSGGCCESGVAASMGESATVMGRGRAVGPMPASARRPGPTGQSGSWPASGALEATMLVLSKSHIGCCGSGVAASMGESATAMGRGRAVGPMPASRPTGRSGLGYPLALEWRNLRLNCQWHTTTTASHCKGQRRCQYLSRCEAVTGPWISGHTDACNASSESCWRGRATRPIFDHRETGSAVLARAGARCGSVAESHGATGQAVTGP